MSNLRSSITMGGARQGNNNNNNTGGRFRKSILRSISTDSSSYTPTGLLRSISTDSSYASTVVGADETMKEMTIECSNLYSVDFVLKELEKAKDTTSVITLTMENALQRGEEQILQECLRLVTDTSAVPSPKKKKPLRRRKKCTSTAAAAAAPETVVENDTTTTTADGGCCREWRFITFIDTLQNADQYQNYQVNSKKFQADLRQMLKSKGITKLRLKFAARLELSPALLDIHETIQFLKTVTKEEQQQPIKKITYATSTDRGVEFKEGGDDTMKDFPKVLKGHFNPETLEWKNDEAVISIHIRYGGGGPNEKTIMMKELMESTNQVLKKSTKKLKNLIKQYHEDQKAAVEQQQQQVQQQLQQQAAVVSANNDASTTTTRPALLVRSTPAARQL